jgi:hypothetical protein
MDNIAGPFNLIWLIVERKSFLTILSFEKLLLHVVTDIQIVKNNFSAEHKFSTDSGKSILSILLQ